MSAASSCWAPAGCSHRRRQCCLPACRVAGDAGATAVQHTSTLPCCWASSLPACQCPKQAPHYTHFDGLNELTLTACFLIFWGLLLLLGFPANTGLARKRPNSSMQCTFQRGMRWTGAFPLRRTADGYYGCWLGISRAFVSAPRNGRKLNHYCFQVRCGSISIVRCAQRKHGLHKLGSAQKSASAHAPQPVQHTASVWSSISLAPAPGSRQPR